MEVSEAIKGRRSIRKFINRPIEKNVLNKIIESGIWAPSGGNSQNWIFIIIDNVVLIQNIKAISQGLLGIPNAIIIICWDKNRTVNVKYGELDLNISSLMNIAMAGQNIMIKAYAENLGSCCIRSFHKNGIKTLLDLPENIEPELFSKSFIHLVSLPIMYFLAILISCPSFIFVIKI
jgi:nitroreductase